MTGCRYIAVNHLLLVLPILQVITSPPRESVWTTPSSQSIGFIAVQILRHIEIHILSMSRQLKNEMESLVSFDSLGWKINFILKLAMLKGNKYM